MSDDTNPAGALVTQADRDLAHEIMHMVRGYAVRLPNDRHWLIDLLARHRLASDRRGDAVAGIPAGWKLVPVALDRAMYEAGEVECRLQRGACKVFAAILAAAPAAPASDAPAVVDGCSCQRYPTHQANDCPAHGLEPPHDGRPLEDHQCWSKGLGRLTHRHWFQGSRLMPTCERCGTPIDREHKEVGPVTWTAPERNPAPAVAIGAGEMEALVDEVARKLEPIAWAALGAADTLAHQNRRISSERKARAIIPLIYTAGRRAGREEAARVADKRAAMAPTVSHEAARALLQALPNAIRNLDKQEEGRGS